MPHFLIIQTAFTGDVVLATAVVEKINSVFPGSKIDFLLRKGNEGLLDNHPFLNKLWTWDKTESKLRALWDLGLKIRNEQYTHVVNLHRFGSSGFITALSGAPYRSGFDKNPFSFFYTRKVKHIISPSMSEAPVHELTRNQWLIADLCGTEYSFPKLYPSSGDWESVSKYKQGEYICIAPSSVWLTKQFPADKWVNLIKNFPENYSIYLLGGRGDKILADYIMKNCQDKNVINLCGVLNFLASAALMQGATMNYTNDSAPLHFATAMDAPVTAVFCSTVPAFGFGPVRENGHVVQIATELSCRPCGLHGKRSCPENHFKCALEISNKQLLWWTTATNKI